MLDVLINVLIVCGMLCAVCITLYICTGILVFSYDSFKSYFKKDDSVEKKSDKETN